MVHAPRRVHPDGGHPALWCLLHRALLHLLRYLREPVLLPVRVPLPRLHHPRHLLLPDLHCDGLLSALWRGLPLVVEVHLFILLLCFFLIQIEFEFFFSVEGSPSCYAFLSPLVWWSRNQHEYGGSGADFFVPVGAAKLVKVKAVMNLTEIMLHSQLKPHFY